jgi:hypothetical protein
MNTQNDARGLRMSFNNAKMALVAAILPDNVAVNADGVTATNPGQQSIIDNAWSVINNAVLSQSYLRLEQALSANTNTYTFAVLDQGVKNQTEIRLTMQDAFYCAAIRISLCLVNTANPNANVLSSYPNPALFVTPTGLAAALEVIYNGYFLLQVNKQTLIPQFPMMNFRKSPITQFTLATNSPIDQWDGQDFQAMQPNAVFIGQKGNLFQIVLPSNIAVAPTNVKLVVEIDGVLAQNVTVVS